MVPEENHGGHHAQKVVADLAAGSAGHGDVGVRRRAIHGVEVHVEADVVVALVAVLAEQL